jgi:hypothetical protein
MSAAWLLAVMSVCGDTARPPEVVLSRDDAVGRLSVVVDGAEILAYQYGAQEAVPHYWPLRSPSGKLLTVQQTEPYPHHRSLWIADHVRGPDAPAVDFYHWVKNYRTADRPESGFRHSIRHRRFGIVQPAGDRTVVEAELQWTVDPERPVLDEQRALRIVALGAGEYFLDLTWTLRASHGPVHFVSDQVHYAWPFVRVHPRFSGEQGGTLVNDSGQRGQAATDGKAARWIDYFNTVEHTTEGIALMLYPDGRPHKWLTREYGTFGPRRSDDFSGTQFTLPMGSTLQGRVGILIHRGDVDVGQVAQRYQQYVEGRL